MRQGGMLYRVALVSVLVVMASVGVRGGPGTAATTEPPPVFLAAFGDFLAPWGVAVDPTSGDVLAAGEDGLVHRYTAGGGSVTSWAWDTPPFAMWTPGIVLDGSGNVFVSDCIEDVVRKFSPSGTLLATWGGYGGFESPAGKFSCPRGLAVDPLTGDLLVADYDNFRIQRLSAAGAPLDVWSGRIRYPQGVAVDPTTRDVLVVEGTFPPHRVWRFTADGTYLDDWDGGAVSGGALLRPRGIAVDEHGDVYVADTGNNRVTKYTADGELLTGWGSAGDGHGEFDQPSAIAVADGIVYVADTMNGRLQKFGPGSRPDARIRLGSGGWAGEDVYNTTGAGQTRKAAVHRGGTVTYTVSVQNDSTLTEAIRLRGQGSSEFLAVVYEDATGARITREVVDGTFRTPSLGPQEAYQVRVLVTVRRTAPRDHPVARTVTGTSTTYPTAKDTVRFVTSCS